MTSRGSEAKLEPPLDHACTAASKIDYRGRQEIGGFQYSNRLYKWGDNTLFQQSSLRDSIEAVRSHQCALEAARKSYEQALQQFALSRSFPAGKSAVENLLRRLPPTYELLICLDQACNLEIDRAYGSASGAPLTQKMLDFAINHRRGATLVHNHPSQGSLSDSDWRILANYSGVARIIAVNSSGSTFDGSLVAAANTNTLSYSLGQSQDSSVTVAQSIETGIERGSLAGVTAPMLEQAKRLVSHLVNERYATRGLVNYVAHLSAGDLADLNDPILAPVITTARAEIASLIP